MTLAQAAAEAQAAAARLEQPAPALARAAQRAADATREAIRAQGLVESGELLGSVYARGASFGVEAAHASFVHARRPFVPVRGGELVEPLATEVREILEAHVEGRS